MIRSRKLYQTSVGFGSIIVAAFGVGFLSATLLFGEYKDQTVDDGSPTSNPSVLATPSLSRPRSAEELGLTQTFLNRTFGYSFRYPDHFTVIEYDSDMVVLRADNQPVLTFTITTRAEERALLKQVEENALVLIDVQDQMLREALTGDGQGRGYPGSNLGFETLKTDSRAIGFTLTNLPHYVGELGGEDTSFLHLRDGHVLVIRQHRSEVFRTNPELVIAILKSVNPFVRQ